ncbi:MAG: HDOD domain-containing protein [Sterolibacterium sp.]
MSFDRREHVRYKPVAALSAALVWQDENGAQKSSAQLNDLSQGGCSLIALDGPLVGGFALAVVSLPDMDAPLKVQSHILSRNPIGNALQISMRFEQASEQQVARLVTALASQAFEPLRPETPATSRKHWRVPQWAAYLAAQQLPVMPRSKLALHAFEAEKGSDLSPAELVGLANGDPFLCLCLLREAENRRTARLGHETSTPLAAVMQLGSAAFRELLLASPETNETESGLAECEARAVMAGQLAAAWSSLRTDATPDEVSMAALLSEIGELLLWHFAPELPQAAQEGLASGEAKRTEAAQEAVGGFKFKDLTLKCAEIWKLPSILVQLIRGQDSARASLARISRDTARHLIAGPDNSALPDDLASAKHLIPQVSMATLVKELRWVPPEMHQDLIEKADLAFANRLSKTP